MTRVLLLGVVLALLTGCSSSPPSSDPELARKLVQSFLASWKAGESHSQFQAANAGCTVAEPRWDSQVKLTEYEFTAPVKPNGFDSLFRVKLSFARDGKIASENAFYAVSTSPRLMIVRVEPGG